MDIGIRDSCMDAPYSERYFNFILRYDDRGDVYEYLKPDCTTVVDNFF